MDVRHIRAHLSGHVNFIRGAGHKVSEYKMLTIPGFLALLMPAPALRETLSIELGKRRRRRAVRALRLAPHLLKDVGLDDYESPADDPRWVRRFELER